MHMRELGMSVVPECLPARAIAHLLRAGRDWRGWHGAPGDGRSKFAQAWVHHTLHRAFPFPFCCHIAWCSRADGRIHCVHAVSTKKLPAKLLPSSAVKPWTSLDTNDMHIRARLTPIRSPQAANAMATNHECPQANPANPHWLICCWHLLTKVTKQFLSWTIILAAIVCSPKSLGFVWSCGGRRGHTLQSLLITHLKAQLFQRWLM